MVRLYFYFLVIFLLLCSTPDCGAGMLCQLVQVLQKKSPGLESLLPTTYSYCWGGKAGQGRGEAEMTESVPTVDMKMCSRWITSPSCSTWSP